MKSARRGRSISATEVTNVSNHGLWLWIGEREVFLSYDRFPWFKAAPVGHVLNVQRLNSEHLHWPDLDIDIHIESIDDPGKYPLSSQLGLNGRGTRPLRKSVTRTRPSRRGAAADG